MRLEPLQRLEGVARRRLWARLAHKVMSETMGNEKARGHKLVNCTNSARFAIRQLNLAEAATELASLDLT